MAGQKLKSPLTNLNSSSSLRLDTHGNTGFHQMKSIIPYSNESRALGKVWQFYSWNFKKKSEVLGTWEVTENYSNHQYDGVCWYKDRLNKIRFPQSKERKLKGDMTMFARMELRS